MNSTKLTIGSDPELILLDTNEDLICAGDVIAEKESAFGVDGHKYIAELRPSPAIHPRDFVSSIRDVLKSRSVALSKYKWRAGPWVSDRPLGGHIHFGTPFLSQFKDALDGQLAPILALSEPSVEAALRRKTVFYGTKPYGLLSDIRTKTWGFEWRTPSSFITSPGVSLGLLTIGKAIIWEEMIRGKQAFSNLSATDRNLLKFDHEDFYQCKRDVFLPKLETLEKQLLQMRYFDKKQEGHDLWPAVSYILHQVIPKKGYDYKQDIKGKWKLLPDTNDKHLKTLSPFWRELIENRQAQDWYHKVLPDQDEQFVIKLGAETAQIKINDPKITPWKPINASELWEKL